MEDFSAAQKMINKIDVQKLNKNKWALYYNKKGFIDYKLNNFITALSNYVTAKKYNPKLDYIHNNLGVIYFQLNNFEKAKEYYLNAISLNSNYTKVLVNLAVVDFYMRNYIAAFNWFKKALGKNKGYIQERWNREKAMKKLIELSKKYPEDQDLKYILEWAKENYNKDITEF